MADYTFEGKTRQPLYPTTIHVNYTDDVFAAVDTDATANWKNPATAHELAPNNTALYQVLNTSPQKATISNSGKYITLLPGVWRARVEIHGRGTGGTVEPRIAVCDDAATANTFFEYDGDGDTLVSTTENADATLSGLINISVPTNIRLVLAEAGGGGTWTLLTARILLRRISNYVAS